MRRVIGAAERAAWTEVMLVASRLARTATRMASRAEIVQCFTAMLLLSISGLCIQCTNRFYHVASRADTGALEPVTPSVVRAPPFLAAPAAIRWQGPAPHRRNPHERAGDVS